jgi:serine protease Do
VHVRGEMPDGSAAGESDGEGGRTSIGTGFIINKDGYLLTNEHVVRGVIDLRVRLLDGRELGACVVGADMATDLALLKVTTKRPLPVLALGDSAAVRVGEPVIAIGNPYGFNHSVTAGIVSAKERVVDRASLHEPGAEDLYSFFIQTDASINLGNSGGPLIDASGAVIGVNAAFWAGHPLQPAQGIGFAIPINMAKALLPRLMQTGTARRAYLGVDAQPVDPALEAALKLPSGRGALIASIEKGSPAEAAGLEPGDVVVNWNGADVATSEDFKIDAQLSTPGARIRIALLRDGKRSDREIIPRAAVAKEVAPPHPSSCGRTPEPLMANVDDFDVQVTPARPGKPAGGVTVTRVTDHSAAAQAGLRVGDAVLRIGKANVLAPADVAKALGGFQLGDPVPMLVRRSGFDFWMAFTRR